MFLFLLLVICMWSFVGWSTYQKIKYRKREKWAKAFKKLSAGNDYDDIYEELADLSYKFKGTAYELIDTSRLPQEEKDVARLYFKMNVYKEKNTAYGVSRITNIAIWVVSIIVMLVVFFMGMYRDIHSEEDIFVAIILLALINFVVQTVLHVLVISVRLLLERRAAGKGKDRDVTGTFSKGSKISTIKSVLEKILFN